MKRMDFTTWKNGKNLGECPGLQKILAEMRANRENDMDDEKLGVLTTTFRGQKQYVQSCEVEDLAGWPVVGPSLDSALLCTEKQAKENFPKFKWEELEESDMTEKSMYFTPEEADNLKDVFSKIGKLFTGKTADEEIDTVNKPSHYQGKYGMEAIDVVRNFAGDLTAEQGFYWGNAIKYMLRFQAKNGLEDLKEAQKNLSWLIEELEKEQNE